MSYSFKCAQAMSDQWSMLLLSLFLTLFSPGSHARSTDLCFSEAEVSQMRAKSRIVSEAASKCLQSYWDTHVQFFRANGYSKYYGNRNESLKTDDLRRKVILLAVWPDFLSRFRPAERVAMEKAKGLKELEQLVQKYDPRFLAAFKAKVKELKIVDRAKDELYLGETDSGFPKLRPNLKPYLQNISCIDMARRCLQAGFEAGKLDATWAKIDRLVKSEGVSGAVLQKALADLGWHILYFNPDTSMNEEWDREDKVIAPLKPKNPGDPMPTWNPIWGAHAERWSGFCEPDGKLRPGKERGGVLCSDHYEVGSESPIPVDDKNLLVNFGIRVPSAFRKVPFFLGTAHSGYHVFPGFYGQVIEAHSMKKLTSRENIERSLFNPLDEGGGPRWTKEERYRSGVIAVPPGTIGLPALKARGGRCVDLRPGSPR